MLLHPVWGSVPSQDSGGSVKTWGRGPKSELEINMKANAQMRKRITNFFLEMLIEDITANLGD